MYALNLDENNRILSVTEDKYAPDYQSRVESFPEGDIYEYLYVDGGFIHSPLPELDSVIPEPTTEEILDALLGVEV